MNKSRKISSCQMADQELDDISQLPEPLINNILSLMPIRDAVRTSILSSSWRSRWTNISKLVFDDNIDTDESSKLVKIINKVLLLHSGHVEKFMLSHKKYRATRLFDIWTPYLSKASMREFILKVCKGPPYKVSSCSLFSFQDLTQLVLYNCSLNIPTTFRGFKNLKTLNLRWVKMTEQVLENFISDSRLLENLILMGYHFKKLVLDVPKLGYLRVICGSVNGISFKRTYCSPLFRMKFTKVKGCANLLDFFAPLQSIETLRLDDHALKYLSIQEVPALLAEQLVLLKNLFISGVNFKSVKELLVILCLLRSAPNLKQLKVLAAQKEEHISEVDDCSGIEICDSSFTFAHLNSVSLTVRGDSALEMKFIEILRSSSPVLEKMTIEATKSSNSTYVEVESINC